MLGLKSVKSNIQIVSKDNLNHDSKAVSSNNRRYRFDYWVILDTLGADSQLECLQDYGGLVNNGCLDPAELPWVILYC